MRSLTIWVYGAQIVKPYFIILKIYQRSFKGTIFNMVSLVINIQKRTVFKLIGDFTELVSIFFSIYIGPKGGLKSTNLNSPQQLQECSGAGLLGAANCPYLPRLPPGKFLVTGGQPQLTLQPFLGVSPGSMGQGEQQLVTVLSGHFAQWPQAWHQSN